jgi:cell cycle checkpoint protein MEC1
VLSHSSSNDEIRRNRINQILQEVQNSDSSYGTIIESAQELFESLIKIAKVKISKSPRTTKLSLSKDFKVSNLFKPHDALVIPVRSNLEIRLPANKMKKFNAFPKSASITFDGFDDVVNIFFSLQMPRQVTVRGSDNKPYRLMVKRDDTRKDAKVVEFTTMINRILLASNEARKRGLSISNYSVVPLTENMGVIEFVVDVQTLKGITSDQRRRMGKSINDRKVFMKLDEAQKLVRGARSSTDTSLNNLVKLFEQICNDYPPVLHQWFINQFSDPSAWYSARNLFIRSSAVMSMVGYIIGLGDRHCENILFFKKTGSVLHIDFDCLFDKGATLPTPEIVPFRLTQNMVDAMGICGIEGSFRLTCEVTGTLLREHEAPLMNILETLLYDPLLDWKSVQNPEAHLSKVRRKIMGLMNEKEGLPMNVHGQVDLLIQEATSVERLAQMYGGWAAYI